MIVGDGDCGYTLRDGANQVLAFIDARENITQNLPEVLDALVEELENNMGGTSGALYAIFLSALAQGLKDEPTLADALCAAQAQLLKYTRARLGDRTCLDCLLPFVAAFKDTGGDAPKALKEAEIGLNGTLRMEAKLGRSAYLDSATTDGTPDPGAYGVLKLLEGMINAKF